MNQRDFQRAVAKATGESAGMIAQRGFSLLTAGPREREPRPASYEEFLESVLCHTSSEEARCKV
jgi:hypothetical protein